MKRLVLGALAFVASGLVVASDEPVSSESRQSVVAGSQSALPPGFTSRLIFRIKRDRTATHITHHYWPDNWEDIGWELEDAFGYVSSTPFDGGVLIRSCVGPHSWNYFTSGDLSCEPGIGGVIIPGDWNIGYISTIQHPGSVPLYRCSFWWGKNMRHFDTLSADCEGTGAFLDGTLGYVFR
ncbi:hypothetical protein ACI703_13830 [Isoptericola jiangsuensis]|uniref:hypothetical protein n=1 Tax=Isoptericola jiangsuensis TaxID=548579 RepID=UPI00386F80D5